MMDPFDQLEIRVISLLQVNSDQLGSIRAYDQTAPIDESSRSADNNIM